MPLPDPHDAATAIPETEEIHLLTKVFSQGEENMAQWIALALPAFVWKLSWYMS